MKDKNTLPVPLISYTSGLYEASSSVNTSSNILTPPVFKIIEGIRVYPSKNEFRYGNCATIAICQAFDIPRIAFRAICKLMRITTDEIDDDSIGLSFFECKKIINLLSDSCRCTSKYIPNIGKVSYAQMLLLLNTGSYLTMFGNHLSYAEDGEVFDSYLYNIPSEVKDLKVTGWWKINT